MKRIGIPLVLLTAVVASAYASSSINWKKGYPAAAAEAKSSGKLIMIDFYTDWCGWCKKLDADTYPAPEVVKQSENFVPIKLDAEKDADGVRLAKKFGINGYPTILFIDADEKLAYKVVGYQPAKDFAASLVKAARIPIDKPKFTAALAANPNDFGALVGMAGIEASAGDVDKAAARVDLAAKNVPAAKKGDFLDACNAVGDGYQNGNQFEKAIPYFKKAIVPGFDSHTAYARMSIGFCYLSLRKLPEAKVYFQDLLKMDNADKQYKDTAKQILDQMAKQK